ncbi:MAG: RNA methyltransferase [Planctomycetota bacterium]
MSEAITSTANPRVKRVVALRKGHKAKEAGVLIAEGWREIERAAGAGLTVREAYAVGAGGVGRLAETLRVAEGATVMAVSPEVLAKMAYHREPEGVLAVFERPAWTWEDLEGRSRGKGGDVLVAVGMDKPGNLGAMVRTAAAAGLAGVVAAGEGAGGRGGVDVFNANAIRASTGAVFDTPVVVADEAAAIDWLKTSGHRVMAAMVDGATDYRNVVSDHRSIAIVIGPEDRGLDARWRELAEATGGGAVSIPMADGSVVDSLNASVAAGVLTYGIAHRST